MSEIDKLGRYSASARDGYRRKLAPLVTPAHFKFRMGDPVRKKTGSKWRGRVVGFYSSTMTAEGYAVESDLHEGSVQIYPVAALERSDV